MFDLIIQQARICDGTGNPSFVGTLGVTDGHITYLGRETGLAARWTMNADGLVVTPGFIDPHTHYDAQIAWDPLLTSSPWHGVTTVVMGNCGVGVAPVKPETRDLLMHDLVNVEAIPYDVMEAGIDWQRAALSLEQAVHKLTAAPAALFGIPNRGTLAEGYVADLVLFDPQTVAAKPPEYVRDFPRQGRRLISKAEGIVATVVSGTQVYAHGAHTGAFPGRVLRSHA
jgi:N-acyl-D-aspartate/D-glutamate deacylase